MSSLGYLRYTTILFLCFGACRGVYVRYRRHTANMKIDLIGIVDDA